MPRDKNGRENRALDPFVVVRVYTDFLLFGAEWVLADLEGLQLVVALEVGPAPHATVYHVGQAFAVRYLELENIAGEIHLKVEREMLAFGLTTIDKVAANQYFISFICCNHGIYKIHTSRLYS